MHAVRKFLLLRDQGSTGVPLSNVLHRLQRLDLDLGGFRHRIGAPLDPIDRLLHGTDLPQPVPGHQLIRLRKRPVRHRAIGPVEPHPDGL